MHQMKITDYGNKIYPIVAQHHPKLAGKITGMFLGTGMNEFNEALDNESYLEKLIKSSFQFSGRCHLEYFNPPLFIGTFLDEGNSLYRTRYTIAQ